MIEDSIRNEINRYGAAEIHYALGVDQQAQMPANSVRVGLTVLDVSELPQIEFTEWTPDGHLRHLKFVGLREDKEARELVREGNTAKQTQQWLP